MSLHHAAKHLASKGRNGDTTLVHMTKGEVAGLQALAKRHGTTLTKNPDTGLPEAFGLKQLLPMAAGAALVASGVGAPMAAAMVGGGMFAATGSLKQGLMAGLGAYGGAGLAGGLGAMGAEAGTAAAAGEAEAAAAAAAEAEAAKQTALQTAGQEAVTPQAIEQVAGEQAARNAVGNQAVWEQSARDYASNAAGNTYELNGGYSPAFGPEAMGQQLPGATTDVMIPSNTGFSASTQQTLAQNPMQSGLEAAYKNPGAYVDKLGGGMQATKYGMAAAAPAIDDAMTPKPYAPPERKVDADMGQRYAYDSGYDNSVPGRTGQAEYKQISNEEAKKLYGFAEGGDVQYPYGESVVRMAEGGSAAPSVGYEAGPFSGADYSGYGTGSVGNYSGYDTAPNMGIAAVAPAAARASSIAAPANGMRYDPSTRSYVGSGPSAGNIYKGGGEYGLDSESQKILDAVTSVVSDVISGYDGGGGAAGGGLMQSYVQGGISTLGSYSDGGRMLKGPGDGMSDNIPAVIGGKQPARLADGEFVVPADVVSHLGNGSTDAGAKQLYKMMDKIRQARTGKKAQGKQINPNKFTPA